MILSVIPSVSSVSSTAFALFLELIMVLWVMRIKNYPHKMSETAVKIAFILCLLDYLFCMVGGDYFAYKNIVETAGHTDLSLYSSIDFHVELPHVAIINFVNNNYLLYRLVVWGGALLVFYITSLRLNLDKCTFVFYLSIFIVPFTCTSRVAIALAVSFFGFSLITKPFHNYGLLSSIMGISLCFGAMWLHRSAPFLLVIYPLSLMRFNKYTISFALIALFIIAYITNTGIIDYIFSLDTTLEDSIFDAQTAQSYLESDKMFINKGPAELIRLTLSYITYFLVFVLMIKSILSDRFKGFPRYIQSLCNATVLIIVFSVLFLLMPGANTYKTFERLIGFSIVPTSFVCSYFLKNNYKPKLMKYVNIAIYSWVLYTILHIFYLDVIL